jgi:hypothetical protein
MQIFSRLRNDYCSLGVIDLAAVQRLKRNYPYRGLPEHFKD